MKLYKPIILSTLLSSTSLYALADNDRKYITENDNTLQKSELINELGIELANAQEGIIDSLPYDIHMSVSKSLTVMSGEMTQYYNNDSMSIDLAANME